MTSGTALQYSTALNPVFRFQRETFRQLFFRFVFLPPLHVVNLVDGPHEPFRRAVTLQTPLHLERLCLVENRHLVDAPVTRRAADTFFHVNAVIEVGVIRQVVYAYPLDRLAGAKTRAHRFEIRTVSPDLFVAVHARRRRRQSRRRGRFDRGVTVTTIDAVVADVMFMTELNGLLTFDPLAGVPGGTIQLDSDPKQSDDYEYSAINRDFRQRVRAVMEDLWHYRGRACRALFSPQTSRPKNFYCE